MKRHGYLFEKAFSRENLYAAYLDASKGKHKKRGCYNFERRLARNLDKLYNRIHSGTYKPAAYYMFSVWEPKHRTIYAPSFHDLVVQHAIYRIIYPIFDVTFIDQSFACRKGLGTHKASDYAQKALQQSDREKFSIKLDIRKFFYRIDRCILRAQIEKKIKDKKFVDVMMQFAEYGEIIGIPIGNLLSQIYALIYLNSLDHFVKRVLKVEKYCRYVDDFILFNLTKEQCEDYLERIIKFLTLLKLELSKYTIAMIKRGVNFVGYRTWASKKFVRKHSLYRFAKSAKHDKLLSVISILGHAKNTHSQRHLINTLKEKYNDLYLRLPKIYRRSPHNTNKIAYG